MTNTPRTEDAWRDATMGSRRSDWLFVAQEMRKLCAELEAELVNGADREISRLHTENQHLEDQIQNMRERARETRNKIDKAVEILK